MLEESYDIYKLIITQPYRLHERICWKHKKKWHIFLEFHFWCNVNLYSKMVDKLSKGSNSNSLRYGSINPKFTTGGQNGANVNYRGCNLETCGQPNRKNKIRDSYEDAIVYPQNVYHM